jgi:hypothetical protein
MAVLNYEVAVKKSKCNFVEFKGGVFQDKGRGIVWILYSIGKD